MARRIRGGVRVDGLDRVVRDLQAMGLEVDDLKDAFSDIAREGADLARGFAPRGETGQLAGSVRGNRAKSKAVVTAGRSRIPYAGVQEYGWREHNITGTGYLQRADQAMRPRALKHLQREIDQQIRRRGLG